MTQAEAAAQTELRQIVDLLEGIRFRLGEVVESLPPSPGDLQAAADENQIDLATEIRTTIECVLNDSLRPAIQDLRAAASTAEPS